MDILRALLFVTHLLGVVALFVGLLTQARRPHQVVNRLMRDGAGTAVGAAVLLVVVISVDGGHLSTAKIAVKSLIGLTVLALVMANVRKQITRRLWSLLLLLAVVNVTVAVAW